MIDLAIKDLIQIFRDWKAAMFLFAMPITFTLVFGFAFGGFGANNEEEGDSRLPVGLVDNSDSYLGSILTDLIDSTDIIRPVKIGGEVSFDEIESLVEDDEYFAILIVPDVTLDVGFGNSTLQVMTVLKQDSTAGQTAQNSLQSVVNRFNSAVNGARFGTNARREIQSFTSEAEMDAYFVDRLYQAAIAWENPPLAVMATQTGTAEDSEGTPNPFAQSSSGMMVQFAMAGLIGAATVIVLERRTGTMQRLLTTSINRSEILVGHYLAMFAMIFIQLTILIGFAAIFLDVSYFREPLATLIITLATTLFTASMGMLIGTLAKNEEQVVMFSLIPMFILSGLGGAWVPLEFTSESFQKIGHFTPIAWALDGFQNIIMRGRGLESVLLPALVLIGFTVLCLSLAVWRFKFE
jgi:ABC-2 type transport system permease protein